MEQTSRVEADVKAAAKSIDTTLEGQLREMYGRVAYTHKTHEKMADRYVLDGFKSEVQHLIR